MWTEGKKIHESYYDGERKDILKKKCKYKKNKDLHLTMTPRVKI